MRVAVTGAGGRLGRALVEALGDAPFAPAGPIAWRRPDFELDELTPESLGRLLDRDRPEVVVHAAAWTDVDGCAREPDLAMRRNGEATGLLADACAARGVDLVAISTNEVFDGRRNDGRGYRADDEPNPINAYGASKLAGERAAAAAFERVTGSPLGAYVPTGRPVSGVQLAIVRTAWLYGPPGNDFPAKILAAAERAAAAGEPLALVADEIGSPTFTLDLAEAIVELIGSGEHRGIHHLVDSGIASRADWGRAVLAIAGIDVPTRDVPAATWPRASTPPAWAVLEPTPLPGGEPLRPWQAALADYVPSLVRRLSAAADPTR
ncbi:MAG TPA: NAD(P)-dependent oxidoreductase [Candidatus Limnocylindrales bacterium]|nr:NAD(P)-dependent oxidoreductase [Candidatus Limnocylindrales bacterium]